MSLRQRLRWSKGHLQAFAESGWGLFKNIFIDKNTKHKEGDKWYNYLWRTIRHRFMSFDTFKCRPCEAVQNLLPYTKLWHPLIFNNKYIHRNPYINNISA